MPDLMKGLIFLGAVGALTAAVLWPLRRRIAIVGEFLQFLRERKLWWMTPIAVILIALGILAFAAGSSGIAGVLYTLF